MKEKPELNQKNFRLYNGVGREGIGNGIEWFAKQIKFFLYKTKQITNEKYKQQFVWAYYMPFFDMICV